MCRERNCSEMKKTGKKVFAFLSCLIILSGIGMLCIDMAEKKSGEGEESAEGGEMSEIGEDNDIFRQAGEFDNPIDEFYLPMISASSGEEKAAVLDGYENAWRGQLEEYLEDYRSRCRYVKDKEMSEEYLAAVQMAVDAQKELMEYIGVEIEEQIWHSAQIYRCAYIKDIQGTFTNEEVPMGVMNVGMREMQSPEAFDLEWCNELGNLTMALYENLDEEGRRLTGVWQQSRENWKAAADIRFWRTPEELNAEPEDAFSCGNEMNAALMEKDGWINRLYCQQINSMISVDDSSWKDIGELTIVFWSERGSRYEIGEEELEGMQSYLEHYYPEKEIAAEDFARGDLNGDGIEDIAVTGLSVIGEEEKENFRDRYVYLFIGKEDGNFIPLTPIESLKQGMGDPYGECYEGIKMIDDMLIVQVSGGGNWRWGNNWRTGDFNIYQYEEGKMKEMWGVNLQQYAFTTGMVLTIEDEENNQWKQYAAVGDTEECKELLLLSEDTGETDLLQEQLDMLVGQFEDKIQKPIPKVLTGRIMPETDSLYDYHIFDYETAREPVWVLEKAAEEFLTKAQVFPVCYASEEIKDSYEKLIGVELPEQFYIGLMKEEPVLLYYNGCEEEGDGFVHELVLGIADEKEALWRIDCRIYYDENEDAFRFND